MPHSVKHVWLDGDPGHDDCCAILLAGYNNRIQLRGISTVACNQTVEKTTVNALAFVHAAGLDTPVFPGAARPLMRPMPILCPEIHGESGLDNTKSQPLLEPSPCLPQQLDSLQGHMYHLFKEHYDRTDERMVLICTGALTNAALLVMAHRDVVQYMDVVVMGGAMGIGNTGPVQEFNIQTDPEAAKVVFESGVHLSMVPLEVTHTALATASVLAKVQGGPTPTSPFRAMMVELLTYFAQTYRQVFSFDDPPLHDPCAVALVIAPELFELRHMRVDIETVSQLSAGQTVCDVWGQSKEPKNVHVAMRLDMDGFWNLMLDAVSSADQRSPLNQQAV